MRRLAARVQAIWRVLWGADRLDAAMREEMRFHIEMEAERLARELGIDSQEAWRQAHLRFGGLERYKEEAATLAAGNGSTRWRSTPASPAECWSSTGA